MFPAGRHPGSGAGGGPPAGPGESLHERVLHPPVPAGVPRRGDGHPARPRVRACRAYLHRPVHRGRLQTVPGRKRKRGGEGGGCVKEMEGSGVGDEVLNIFDRRLNVYDTHVVDN